MFQARQFGGNINILIAFVCKTSSLEVLTLWLWKCNKSKYQTQHNDAQVERQTPQKLPS